MVGTIIGLLGVSQLSRFGAVAYVPELAAVAHFRELGPLITAIISSARRNSTLSDSVRSVSIYRERFQAE